MRKKLLSILALLCLTVTSAWATDWFKIQVTATGNIGGSAIPEQSFTYYSTLPCSKTLAECYQAATGSEPSAYLTVSEVFTTDQEKVAVTSNNWNTTITINEACAETVTATLNAGTVSFAITATLIPSWESDKCTVMKDGGKLIVTKTDPDSETGTMEDYENANDRGWKDYVGDITSIVIKDGVTSIGMLAFAQCNITSVTIPASVTSIGYSAFWDCEALETVNFTNGSQLETIGGDAFVESKISSITIPASVKTIGDEAFYSCENLETVTLNSNPYVGENAFAFIKNDATITMNLTANAAGDAKWMTFCSTFGNFQADENTQVFQAELSETGGLTLREIEDGIVSLEEPVILKSSGNPVMTLVENGSDDLYEYNNLTPVHSPYGRVNDGHLYVLNYTEANGVGFYKLAEGKTLGYGKACLWYDSSESNFFGFEDETTSIGASLNDKGKMKNDNSFFDLSGRKIENPTKGLYIVNGKKVIIK